MTLLGPLILLGLSVWLLNIIVHPWATWPNDENVWRFSVPSPPDYPPSSPPSDPLLLDEPVDCDRQQGCKLANVSKTTTLAAMALEASRTGSLEFHASEVEATANSKRELDAALSPAAPPTEPPVEPPVERKGFTLYASWIALTHCDRRGAP